MENFEIDLSLLFSVLRKRFLWIIATALACGVIAFSYAQFFVTPQYTATAKLYVYNDPSIRDSSNSNSSSGISSARSLVSTYLVILKSDTVLDQVIEALGVDWSTATLRNIVYASAVNDTEVFSVTATYSDPAMAQKIANTIADVAPAEIIRVVKAGSVEVVDYAKLPTAPSYPNVYKITLIGLMGGAVLCYGVFLLLALLDTKIRDEDDLAKYELPVLGIIPAFEAIISDKECSSSGYGSGCSKEPEAGGAGKGKCAQ